MKAFIDWNKKYIAWWQKKLNISDYGVLWITLIKGIFIGLSFFYQLMKKLTLLSSQRRQKLVEG